VSGPRVEALLSRLEKGRLKAEALFAGLGPEQWSTVVYPEPIPWTVRDLLAHFVSAELALLRIARDIAAGGQGAPEGFDFDAYNAQERGQRAGVPPADLLRSLAEARRATLEWTAGLSDEALDRSGRHPALGEVSLETLLLSIYGHQLFHARDLQARLTRTD
jgi:hypothetical protein